MHETQLTNQFALDVLSTQKLKHSAARGNQQEALREAAVQFEALFLQKMLQSMRDAIPTSDLLKSQQTEFYDSLMDKQWAQHLSGQGIGLADQLVSQISLQRNYGKPANNQINELIAGIPRGVPRVLPAPAAVAKPAPEPAGLKETTLLADSLEAQHSITNGQLTGRDFVNSLESQAHAVAKSTGLPASLMMAQAVLETGWGSRQIFSEDGSNSHNLFGIKAGSGWQGDTIDVVTHEYVDGRRQKVTEKFRAYDSYQSCFEDYAALMAQNPRYERVISAGDERLAAQALQEAGYATDPQYASKLIALMKQNLTPGQSG